MSRPVDWSPVGLDVDPTPGDPVLVLAGGRDYLDVAAAIDDAASAMARLDVAGTISQAVDAVMDRKEDVIADVRKAHGRYVAAGQALVSYAGVLDRVQSETLTALNKAIAALDDAAGAKGTQSYWQQLADDTTDVVEKNTYQAKATTAGHTATSAHATVVAAQGDIDTAVADRDTAANTAIDHITEITSHDDLNDSWWDDWGSKVVAAIADIADVISSIAGVLAIVVAFIPVVGQALAGVLLVIAAVAAITSALANIALAATGERSWAEAGVAIAGAALSVIGLGAAAKAATGISKVALKAGAKESLAGLRGIGKTGLKGFAKKAVCKIGFGTCFTAGTLVRTPDGDRPIEDIRAGDKVWTHDLATGSDVLETVEETFIRQTTRLYHLTVAGERITTTDEHPFMVAGLGWIHARDLTPGDHLVTAENTVAATASDQGAGRVHLDAINAHALDDDHAVTVYNLHVQAHHTYYVVAGDHLVLVHNAAGYGGSDLCLDGEIGDDVYDAIEGEYGPDIAAGVEYQVARLHDGTTNAVNHEIPGIGHDPEGLASYFASWRDRMTHLDTRHGSRVAYDDAKGVLIVTNGYMVHGYKYALESFESLERYRPL